MNMRKIGTSYEEQAVVFLEQRGVRIVCTNYRCRFGEIDIIGYEGDYLVFFEVKYRTNDYAGTPEDAIDYKKQKKICKVADYYRMMNQVSEFSPIRFDAITMDPQHLHWYKNAFSYC